MRIFMFACLTVCIVGCGTNTVDQSHNCTPGDVKECPCGGGSPAGTHTCVEGLSWGKCDCKSSPDDGNTDDLPNVGPKPSVVGQVSGAGFVQSSNYSLRVTIGGSPMATTRSGKYSAVVGVGAIINK